MWENASWSRSANSVSSSSHDRTTDPYRQMDAISCKSRSSSGAACMMAKPSAYACSIPYSMPLWTIFTKWPAPDGPTWAYPSSGANAVKIGSTTATAAGSPPTIRQ